MNFEQLIQKYAKEGNVVDFKIVNSELAKSLDKAQTFTEARSTIQGWTAKGASLDEFSAQLPNIIARGLLIRKILIDQVSFEKVQKQQLKIENPEEAQLANEETKETVKS